MSRVRDLEWPSRMPEEDWEEVSLGIPSTDEPFIKKYLEGQAQLIEQEKKQRSGTLPTTSPFSILTHPLTQSRLCVPSVLVPTC